MRVMVIDYHYPAFVETAYRDSAMATLEYEEQKAQLAEHAFGETEFEVRALRELGHEAWDALVNVRPLQESWAEEHGVRLSAPHWGIRRRRGWLPWPINSDARWVAEALVAQVRDIRPDVVHVQCMEFVSASTLREVRSNTRLISGQIAAPIPRSTPLKSYDFLVSSLPSYVRRFRAAGADAEWLPLAFEPTLATRFASSERTIPVSFVGSLSTSHKSRIELLETVARRTPVSVWTAPGVIGPTSPLADHLHEPVWGRGMYKVLGTSRLTINSHIDIAAGFANNLRLYEATGMGAMLLTDRGSNLSDLFDAEREVATYSDPAECAEKIEYYVAHPGEAARVAAAGQARTLRDHTWLNRMERLVEMIGRRLR